MADKEECENASSTGTYFLSLFSLYWPVIPVLLFTGQVKEKKGKKMQAESGDNVLLAANGVDVVGRPDVVPSQPAVPVRPQRLARNAG